MNPIANAVTPPAPTGGAALDVTAPDTPASAQEGDGKPFHDALGAALQAVTGEPAKPETASVKPVEGQNPAIDGNGLPLLTPAADGISQVSDLLGQAETLTLTVAATAPPTTPPAAMAPPTGDDGEQTAEDAVSVLVSGKPVQSTAPVPVQPKRGLPAQASAPRVVSVVQEKPSGALNAGPETAAFRAGIDGTATDGLMSGSLLPERTGISADTPGMANPASVASVAASSPSPARAPIVTTSIPMPLASSRWGEALGERVVWMTGNQIQTAQIQINPPNLGPLEVRITMDQGQANVQFSSAHSDVRDAVQAALPRLKEMLGEAGVTLHDVDVSARSFAQQRQDSRASNGSGFGAGTGGGEDDGRADDASLPRPVARGLVDLYA